MQDKVLECLKKGILLSPDTGEELGSKSILELISPLPQIEKPAHISSTEIDTIPSDLKIVETFIERNTKISVQDFINLYNSRFKMLQSMLVQRQELKHATSLRKVQTIEEGEQIAIIGMVLEIRETKNGNLLIVLEDPTGTISGVATRAKREIFDAAKDLVEDEIVGITGSKGNGIIFVNSIITPDVPLNKEYKKSPNEEAAVFISDLHIGSKAFLRKNFERFIQWIKGNVGNEDQQALVRNIKYLFITGDIVEGIGIYPDQDKDLEIKDIYQQYNLFTEYIKQIPGNIRIIITPGNHDSLRVAEPQPPLLRELVPELYAMKNIHLVSSPSQITFGISEGFPGFDVLLYHGYSFPYYGSTIESLRQKGGLSNTENIMEYLMKKRHLAPRHGSTQTQLGYEKDPLVIKNVPDFFVSGHIHRASIKNYRNITLLNCSCWISQTDYQEKMGLVPQPARAIYVDLKTRQTKKIDFS